MVKNNKTEKNSGRIKLHRSFRRSYREDYERKTETPGLMAHAAAALRIIRKNWKIFLPLIGLIVLLYIVLVGLMAESTFVEFKESVETTNKELVKGRLGSLGRAGLTLIGTVTTGGLTNMNDAQKIFAILLFLITWLVSIYLTRHLLAGHKPKMRDGLYNALSPLVSTFFVGLIVFIELIPIMIVIITYQAAISTEFLKTPFYALVYFIFASLMTLLSVYLTSSSIMGLIAVSAPGLYPLTAIETASSRSPNSLPHPYHLSHFLYCVLVCSHRSSCYSTRHSNQGCLPSSQRSQYSICSVCPSCCHRFSLCLHLNLFLSFLSPTSRL